MRSEIENLLQRRQLRRKITFWRILAFLLVLLSVGTIFVFLSKPGSILDFQKDHIANFAIEGIITGSDRQLDLIDSIENNDHAKAVIISINSPGGTTSGGEALYEAILELSKKKPVVVSMQGIATSAGYMIALPAERIFARRNTITGSIGVLFQYADVSVLLDKVGVSIKAVKSSPMKAEPSPFGPASAESLAMIELAIRDSYEWFVSIVAKHRPFDLEEAKKLADGRILTGRQALAVKLVDQIGGIEIARKWIAAEHNLDSDIPVQKWAPKPVSANFPFAKTAFFDLIRIFTGIEANSGPVVLDGMVSVWHASTTIRP